MGKSDPNMVDTTKVAKEMAEINRKVAQGPQPDAQPSKSGTVFKAVEGLLEVGGAINNIKSSS